MKTKVEIDDSQYPRFSPDGKSIIFMRYCPAFDPRHLIHVYNQETDTLGYYMPPQGHQWSSPSYTHKGDKIVFVIRPDSDKSRDFYSQRHEILPNSQIAIMDLDGSNLRVVTESPGLKNHPVFSHSDQKIIFAQAETIRDSGKTLAADWDLWELDLEGGQLGLFAGPFRFYQLGFSVYFPDDQRVLLAGDGPRGHSEVIGPTGYLATSIQDYAKRYNDSQIFIVSRGQSKLEPPLFTDFHGAKGATLDAEENFYFRAQGLDSKEGLKLRLVSQNGRKKSWNLPPIHSRTTMNFSQHVVSRDGRQIAAMRQDGVPYGNRKIVILDTTSGNWRELLLPNEAVRINQPQVDHTSPVD